MTTLAPNSPSRPAPQTPALCLSQVVKTLEKQVFFVVGCQKSGTTWLQKMINGHPQAVCHGEGYFAQLLIPLLQQVVQAYNGKHKAGAAGNFDNDGLRTLIAAAIGIKLADWCQDKPDALAVGDKTPEHAQALPALDQILPGIRAIHVVRDPRDVVVSGWHHNVRQKGDAFVQQFQSHANYAKYTMEHHWLPYIQAAENWGQSNPDRFVRVRYEDLLDNTAEFLIPVLQCLGLSTEDASLQACLAAGQKKQDVNTDQANTSGSFFRKGQAGGWREELPPDAIDLIQNLGAQWMQQLGYQ